MRRREPDYTNGAPAALCRYHPTQWPDGPQSWYDARDAWEAAGGAELPELDENSNAPDVPFDVSDI